MPMGFTATSISTTQVEILSGIVALLQAEFSTWDTDRIYWTDSPRPDVSHNIPLFIQVHVGGGAFFEPALIGGSPDTVQEQSMIGVTIFRRAELDMTGRFESGILHETEGLVELKRRVLRALTGKQIVDGSDVLTAGVISPVQALEPVAGDKTAPLDSIALSFRVPFTWDLS